MINENKSSPRAGRGRVLIFSNSDAGLYKFRAELIRRLISDGNEVYIAAPAGDYVSALENVGCVFTRVPLKRRGLNPFSDIRLFLNYIKLIKSTEPDLVICYTVKPNVYGGMACRIEKIPYALNVTGLGASFQKDGFIKRLVSALYRISCSGARTVFFENEGDRDVFLEKSIVRRDKTVVLPGAGVNLKEFARKAYPPKTEKTRFLFLGRLMREKGADELLDVAKRLVRERDDVEFDIAGDMDEDYSEKIRELNKTGALTYHGFVRDVRPLIEKCHCFVLPSYHEGMANTLLECGAAGRPLITARIHGCMEAVLDNESGYLVAPRDKEDLYRKMSDFLSLSYEQKKLMASRSAGWVASRFDRDKVVEETIAVLKNVFQR